MHSLMKKRNLVFAFVILSAGYVIFQLVLFWKFPRTEQKTVISENGFSSNYVSVQAFTEVCLKHGFPVFVIDPPFLQTLMRNKSAAHSCVDGLCPSGCNYLCADYPLMTFGVFDQLWRIQEAYKDFHSQSFTITEFVQVASHDMLKVFQNKSSITTHYIFRHGNNHIIHLVIFYQRQHNFYWHGIFDKNQNTELLGIQLQFGKNEGAYSSLDMVKVKIDGLRLRAPPFPLAFLKQVSESHFLECNRSRAEEFYRIYGKQEMTANAKHFYSGAKELLSIAKKVLDEIGVRFWISSGTCLGWFRQCDLIPYSKDVDIGIWIADYDVRLIPSLQNAGLALIHVFGKVNDSFEVSFSGGDIKLDIFFFYEEQDYMWNGGTQARTGKKFMYLFPKFQLCWTLFLDLKVRVPCETIKYIEANYGTNWFQPVKDWDWKKSPPNVRENGQWPEKERAKVIQIYT